MDWRKIVYIIIVLIGLIAIINVAYGGNTSEHTYVPNEYYNDLENVKVVYADADGHFNIPFSDGSKGYCLEYMEEEAVKGDLFIVANTSFAVNNRTGEDVSNLLKVYFIDYEGYKDTDSVRVQHMIWHFTDDFDGWRINKTLVGDIRETAEYKKLPDSDVIRFNSTHNMGYKFNSFVSPYSHHQNYWGYDVWFELINNCCCGDNITNITNVVNNYTNISQDTYINNTTNNITYNYINQTETTLNENNTYYNNTLNNYTLIINNQSSIGTPLKYYIIYIIKQNPLHPNIIIENTPQHQTITPITPIPLYSTGNSIIGISILIIILFSCALYTIYREHK